MDRKLKSLRETNPLGQPVHRRRISDVAKGPRHAGQYEQRRKRVRQCPMESFFNTLKSELVHHCTYRTRDEARPDLFFYIEAFYNRHQRHSALDNFSPESYEQLYHQQRQPALLPIRKTGGGSGSSPRITEDFDAPSLSSRPKCLGRATAFLRQSPQLGPKKTVSGTNIERL